MEEALELEDYLPLSFKSEKDLEYVRFLWGSFNSNCENKQYQFAILPYHMLFMAFVYFNVWQIKQVRKEDFRKALILKGNIEKDFLEATSPFTFHKENERSIFDFLKLVGCPKERIGNYKKLVDARNMIAHTNGHILLNDVGLLLDKVNDILKRTAEIQSYSKEVITECYRNFLVSNGNEDERQYSNATDETREVLIHENFLSMNDIKFCLAYDISELSRIPFYEGIQELHQALVDEYGEVEV